MFFVCTPALATKAKFVRSKHFRDKVDHSLQNGLRKKERKKDRKKDSLTAEQKSLQADYNSGQL